MRIEQSALRFAPQQRLVGVLAMNIDQRFGHFTQLLDGHRRAVKIGTRTAVGIQNATQEQYALRIQVVRPQPVRRRRGSGKVKLGIHFRTFAAGPNEAGVGAIAQGERQGVDQDRLAGTGFAGQRAESRLKIEFQPVNQDEVANCQTTQHDMAVARMV
jgi:hypothetical protein